jgi:hypothetical protein
LKELVPPSEIRKREMMLPASFSLPEKFGFLGKKSENPGPALKEIAGSNPARANAAPYQLNRQQVWWITRGVLPVKISKVSCPC